MARELTRNFAESRFPAGALHHVPPLVEQADLSGYPTCVTTWHARIWRESIPGPGGGEITYWTSEPFQSTSDHPA